NTHILFVILCVFIISIGFSAVVSASGELTNWTHLSSKNGDIPEPGLTIAEQTSSLIFDVDLDGTNDFIITRRNEAPAIVWYQRSTTGWNKYVIDNTFLYIEAGGAFYDIDGDGDSDFVFGGDWRSNHVYWWENPYPDYDPTTPWTRYEIKNSGENKHHDQIFGDFDGDGEVELVFWNQWANKLFLADIPLNPKTTQPWFYTEIWPSGTTPAEGLSKGDIDNDGKIDLLGGGRWFKHISGTDYTAYLIDDSQKESRIAVGDLKEGGLLEVIMVPGDGVGRLKWYECTGDPTVQTNWISHDLLGFDVDHGHSLEIADFNSDGKLDIFVGEMNLNYNNPNAKMWIFLGDGNGNFQTQLIYEGIGNHESKVGDLDGDGDVDILGKPFNWDIPRIDVWLNNGSKLRLDLWERHVIDSTKPWTSLFITSEDINGDNRKDIITGGWWYTNPGSPGGDWVRHDIGSLLKNMASSYDFDGDGDIDILGTKGIGAENNPNFVWAQNNGAGSFTILDNIETGNGNFLQGVAVEHFHSG
ncbi:VCBS repeat-containing protein, partial [bacterium]|nr:VCBS repeat-containing protein [bacterium]